MDPPNSLAASPNEREGETVQDPKPRASYPQHAIYDVSSLSDATRTFLPSTDRVRVLRLEIGGEFLFAGITVSSSLCGMSLRLSIRGPEAAILGAMRRQHPERRTNYRISPRDIVQAVIHVTIRNRFVRLAMQVAEEVILLLVDCGSHRSGALAFKPPSNSCSESGYLATRSPAFWLWIPDEWNVACPELLEEFTVGGYLGVKTEWDDASEPPRIHRSTMNTLACYLACALCPGLWMCMFGAYFCQKADFFADCVLEKRDACVVAGLRELCKVHRYSCSEDDTI